MVECVCTFLDVCRQEEEGATENANLTEKSAFYIRQFQVSFYMADINKPAVGMHAAEICFIYCSYFFYQI